MVGLQWRQTFSSSEICNTGSGAQNSKEWIDAFGNSPFAVEVGLAAPGGFHSGSGLRIRASLSIHVFPYLLRGDVK